GEKVDFAGADLSGSSVEPPENAAPREHRAAFKDCQFLSAVLSNCELRCVDFTGAPMVRAVLENSDLRASLLHKVDASFAVFRAARFGDQIAPSEHAPADLGDSFIARRASFENSDLSGCKLTGADLS